MAKMYVTRFEVVGTSQFPMDMLRYDCCYPVRSCDAVRMVDSQDMGNEPMIDQDHVNKICKACGQGYIAVNHRNDQGDSDKGDRRPRVGFHNKVWAGDLCGESYKLMDPMPLIQWRVQLAKVHEGKDPRITVGRWQSFGWHVDESWIEPY